MRELIYVFRLINFYDGGYYGYYGYYYWLLRILSIKFFMAPLCLNNKMSFIFLRSRIVICFHCLHKSPTNMRNNFNQIEQFHGEKLIESCDP